MSESIKKASPRPGAGRPSRDQAEARHHELLDSALDIFLERGFEQTTMEGVAAAVGMTKRTVYARYPDKAALFIATVQRAIDRLSTADAALATLDTADIEATLTAIARLRVARVMTPEGLKLQRIINTESYRFPQILTMSYEQGAGAAIAFLADLLRRHDNAGAVCVAQPEMAANVFMSMVVSGPVRLIVSGHTLDQQEIDKRIDFSVRLFLNGVRSR